MQRAEGSKHSCGPAADYSAPPGPLQACAQAGHAHSHAPADALAAAAAAEARCPAAAIKLLLHRVEHEGLGMLTALEKGGVSFLGEASRM